MPRNGNTNARGYGSQHRAERAKWEHSVASGNAICWRCAQPIVPTDSWDLGHDDDDRTKYKGPEHTRCNRAAGGRKGAAVTNTKRSMTVREW
jgi:hypothetical protein